MHTSEEAADADQCIAPPLQVSVDEAQAFTCDTIMAEMMEKALTVAAARDSEASYSCREMMRLTVPILSHFGNELRSQCHAMALEEVTSIESGSPHKLTVCRRSTILPWES